MSHSKSAFLVGALLLVPALAACSAATESGDATAENPQELLVATGNIYAPFSYQDSNGESAGYDVEVLKAVDEVLEQYEFTYTPLEMTQVLVAVEQGRADIAAHQWVPNPEREKTYLFGKVPYTDQSLFIASSRQGPKYETLADLEGKDVVQAPGTERWAILEDYNETQATTPINIHQTTAAWEEGQISVDTQTYDATIATWYDVTILGRDVLQLSDEPVQVTETFFVFRKDEAAVQEAIDGALTQLTEDGTLQRISEEVLGSDLSPKAEG